jgi:hypothetical protein
MPRCQSRKICVPESIRSSQTGETETVMLEERYAPYTKQGARIENLCGTFTEYIFGTGLEPVTVKNGTSRDLFHLHGNVTINQGKGAFMGVRGMKGLAALASVLQISSPACNIVHMAVLTIKLGKRVQVSSNGLLETNLEKHAEHLRVEGRMYEHTNAVRFSVVKFEAPQFRLSPEIMPSNNDWMVTGKGMLIIRLSWRRVVWTQEVEAECLSLCERVAAWIDTCSR